MAKQQASSRGFNAVAGALLLSFGLLLLFGNLDEIAGRVGNSFASTTSSMTTVVELGLAGLRAAQAYFFDPSTFQAGLHTILVSFWPLILVIIGATLLQSAIGRRFVNSDLARTFASRERQRES